jgi:hypothetical protein
MVTTIIVAVMVSVVCVFGALFVPVLDFQALRKKLVHGQLPLHKVAGRAARNHVV